MTVRVHYRTTTYRQYVLPPERNGRDCHSQSSSQYVRSVYCRQQARQAMHQRRLERRPVVDVYFILLHIHVVRHNK